MKKTPLYPVFKLLIPFTLGIVLWWLIGDSLEVPIYLMATLIPFFYYYYEASLASPLKEILYVCAWIGILGMGYQLTAHQAQPVQMEGEIPIEMVGNVQKIDINTYSVRLMINSDYAETSFGNRIPLSKVFVKLKGIERYPQIGDRIGVKGSLSEISAPLNPGGFNFQDYAKRKNIYNIIDVEDWYTIKTSAFYGNLILIRDKLKSAINRYAPKTYGVSAAMLLGHKEDLNEREIELFKTSGLMHLLVVSGLHAGLFYGIMWVLVGWIVAGISKEADLFNSNQLRSDVVIYSDFRISTIRSKSRYHDLVLQSG